jgi:hypothetical protein
MTNAPTNLDDARELKAAGLRLNLPLEHRTFSQEYSEHWFGLMEARTRFMIAVLEFSGGVRSGSPGKWKLAKRRLGALSSAIRTATRSSANSVATLYRRFSNPNEMGMNAEYSQRFSSTEPCPSLSVGKAQSTRSMPGRR